MNIFYITIIIMVVLLVLARRAREDKKEEEGTLEVEVERHTQSMNRNKAPIYPARHQNLTNEQLQNIHVIYKGFAEVDESTEDERILIFQNNQDIDTAINLWLTMLGSYEAILKEKKITALEEKKEIYKIITMSSMLSKEELLGRVEIKNLSKSDLEYVLNDIKSRL